MEKFFKLKEHGTDVKTEIVAGITTFFAMAYIIFVNPGMLSATGMEYTAVMVATCVSAAIGCALTALLSNVPFAQAPGMGLNAYFTYTVVLGMGYSWQEGLAIVLLSGLLFLAVAVSPLRSKIISSIPGPLKKAIGGGIGLFIAFLGLLNAGIVVTTSSNITALGSITSGSGLVAIIGLAITAVMYAFKVKGAIFIGILLTTLVGIPFGVTVLPESFAGMGQDISMASTFGKAITEGFGGLMKLGLLPLMTAVVTFAIIDCFDTVGTLIGTAGANGMLDKDGNFPGGDRALIADALATCAGAIAGTSTVTTFVESSTGISEGGRTGLTPIVTGALFLLAILLAPVAGIIPSAATAPALIITGVFMLKNTVDIPWDDFESALPCFLTIVMMPFAYSISDGIGFGFISYTLIKVFRGKAKEVPALMYVLAVLFILKYILSAL